MFQRPHNWPRYESFEHLVATGVVHCDVDNITAKGHPTHILNAVIPVGTPTVIVANRVASVCPSGYAILLEYPIIFVKQSDKRQILLKAASESLSHFRYLGNESDKIVFKNQETFTPSKIIQLLELARVKSVMYVSYAMKGELQWAHTVLKNLQKNRNTLIKIDIAATIPPHLSHLARGNTHQQAPCYNPNRRSEQYVPLVMVDKRDACKSFKDDMHADNFPILTDTQLSCFPKTTPLFGGSVITPRSSGRNRDSGRDMDSDDQSSSAHAKFDKLKIYSDFFHGLRQGYRHRGDPFDKNLNVRETSRILNSLISGIPSMIDGGMKTGLRMELTMKVPKDWIFHDDYLEDEQESHDESSYDYLLWLSRQFHPFLRIIWKGFLSCRIALVPIKSYYSSCVRMYLFLKIGKLPPNAQCISGSSDANQVGHMWSLESAVHVALQVAKGSTSFYGNNWQANPAAYSGRCANMQIDEYLHAEDVSNSDSLSHTNSDSDEDYRPPGGNHTTAAFRLTAKRDGGRYTKELNENQKDIAALVAANVGLFNKTAATLLVKQFKTVNQRHHVGNNVEVVNGLPQQTNNAPLWVSLEAFTTFIHVVAQYWEQSFRERFTAQSLQSILLQLFPNHTCQPAEMNEGEELGLSIYSHPPVILGHENSSDDDDSGDDDVQDDVYDTVIEQAQKLDPGEMLYSCPKQKTVRISDPPPNSLNHLNWRELVKMRVTGMTASNHFPCPQSLVVPKRCRHLWTNGGF